MVSTGLSFSVSQFVWTLQQGSRIIVDKGHTVSFDNTGHGVSFLKYFPPGL